MSNSTRDRIAAAFDRELGEAPVPPGLRALSVRAAVAAPRHGSKQPRVLALVAAILALAVIATLVLVSHGLRPNPVPARSTTPPPARGGASIVYDNAHGVLVVFGGQGNPPLNDTWTWDGKYWTHLHPAISPVARYGAVMGYDVARHNVVLFGGMAQVNTSGNAGQAPVDDTWVWDGTKWQQKHPQHEPAFGFDSPATMTFDPLSRTLLLYGFTKSTGQSGAGTKSQTWSWNGSDWTQLAPSTAPTSIGIMAGAGNQVLLLATSPGQVGGRYLTQTWAWDGSTWNLLRPKTDLPPIGSVSAAYDAARGRLVVLTADTWTWDGSSWSREHPSLQPTTVGYVAYVPSLHEVVSWGDRFSSLDNEMFGWNGTDWTLIDPGTIQASPTNGGAGYLGVMTPDAAAAAVRATVKNSHPVLLPTSLPGGPYDAVVTADADGFNINYRSDLRDKTISLGIVAANPPPGGPNSSDTMVRFRNSVPLKGSPTGYAEYFVYDTTAPTSQRWLMWNEPGTMAVPQTKAPGVPYFLSTEGLTDEEFWQVANSLK